MTFPRLLFLAVLLAPVSVSGQGSDRIVGSVTTRAGVVHEGAIRFETGAASPGDPLTGRSAADAEWEDRVMASMGAEVDARGRSVEFLGVRITWEDDRGPSGSPRTSLAVGDLESLAVGPDGGVRATLWGGERIDFLDGFGWVEVERSDGGAVRVEDDDLASVTFDAAGVAPGASPRLAGVVEDRWGRRWQGPVVWARGQSLTTDSLRATDGRDGRRAFAFRELRSVEPVFGGGARVVVADGSRWDLAGSADVERSSRGIRVADPVRGVATIPWVDVRSVTFGRAAPSPAHATGERGPLLGTVRARDGRVLTGRIHWSDGTRSRWGYLSGYSRSVVVEIPLRSIERLERRTSTSARVHLRGGDAVDLRGGDFDPVRGPIVVESAAGSLRVLEWRAVDSITFEGTDGSGHDAG